MKKIGMCVIALMLSQSALASGILTCDGANLSQNLMSYMDQIKEYGETASRYSAQVEQWAKEYKTQMDQYNQQLTDTAKPVSDIFSSAKQLYDTGTQAYNFVTSLGSQINTIGDYFTNVIGNRKYWEDCASTPGCDLSRLAINAQNKIFNLIDKSLDQSLRTSNDLKTLTDKVADQYSESLKNCDGINCSIQTQANMTAELLKSQAKTNKVLVDFINQQQTEKRLEQQEREARNYRNAVTLQQVRNVRIGGDLNIEPNSFMNE